MPADINTLQNYLKESYEKLAPYYEEARTHKRYAKGDQLPEDVQQIVEDRGQPLEWENIYRMIGNKVMGMKIGTPTEMHAVGRQRQDKAAGLLITQLLRASNDTSDVNEQKRRADHDQLYCGLSMMTVTPVLLESRDPAGHREAMFSKRHISIFEGYPDPYARRPDYGDARYFTEVFWVDRDELHLYYDEATVDALVSRQDNIRTAYVENTNEHGRDRVLLCLTWYWEIDKAARKKKIRYAVWCGDVILEDRPNPYRFLTHRFPVSVRRANTPDPEEPGEFYAMFRDIKPLQDRINFTHIRIAYMLGTIKIIFEDGVAEDSDEFIEQISRDDSAVQVRKNSISKLKIIQHRNDIAQAQGIIADKRQQAKDIAGVNDEALGLATNRLSGYAIEQRQNTGLVGLQQFLKTSEEQERDLAEIELAQMQQYMTAEQSYRIADADVADAYFTINELERRPQGGLVMDPQTRAPKRRNRIDVGKWDLVMVSRPQNRGAVGERQKSWSEVIKTIGAANPRAAAKMIPLMLKDTESPVAQEARELLEAMDKEGPDQAQMQQIQLQLQTMAARLKEMESKAFVNVARAQKMLAEAGMSPEQIAQAFGGGAQLSEPVEAEPPKQLAAPGS